MKERDISVDILRGIAIFAMIAANMAPYNFLEPHSFSFRIYGSMAAPMFIFLAGMMVSYTATIKAHKLNYYLKRALATLAVAMLIDTFIWDILPFVTYDVLYVIAPAMPLIFFFIKLPRIAQLILIAVIFGVTPVLQYYLGYADSPAEVSLSEENYLQKASEISVWRQFLHEGWFPFFPWIGVALSGAFVGSFKFKTVPEIFNKNLLIAGLALLISGIGMWLFFMPEVSTNEGFDGSPQSPLFYKFLITRDGYSELFYPPTLFYLFTFLGFILILIPLTAKFQKNRVLNLLTVYGRSSLLVYILHTLFIALIFANENSVFGNIGQHSFGIFMGLYLLHALVLWLICFGVQKLKQGKQFPFLINFILGG
ncbi:MAG: DUF1624 domain-containing protein [Bacteroidetes bacterium]|nr:DUF1624 domain-containing protein [Bacteroidota bacterium]